MMSYRLFILAIALVFSNLLIGQDTVSVEVKLSDLSFDKVPISITSPSFENQEVIYSLPSYSPGEINEQQSGKLIVEFKAYGRDGKVLKTKRNDSNSWTIFGADKLHKINYWVDDSWDNRKLHSLNRSPLSTVFSEQWHLINWALMVGYFQGFTELPYSVNIQYETSASTVGQISSAQSGLSRTTASNYFSLINQPILSGDITTNKFETGSSEVRLSKTPGGSHSVHRIQNWMNPIFDAYLNYTQQELPKLIDVFVIEETDKSEATVHQFGAARHNSTIVLYIPSSNDTNEIRWQIQKLVAHELMHFYSPMTIKTDVTSHFSFRSRMHTKHLWYEEGVTEYLSLHMLLRQNIISLDAFILEIRNKINLSEYYEPFNAIQVSKQIENEGFTEKYINFYYKGALIAFLLDAQILHFSEGEKDLKLVLDELQSRVTKDYVIREDAFIEQIVSLSHDSIQYFFDRYVSDDKTLPYDRILNHIALQYEQEQNSIKNLFAEFSYHSNAQGEVYIKNIKFDNVGLLSGDQLMKIGRTEVRPDNVAALLHDIALGSPKTKVVFQVKRNSEVLTLKAEAVKAYERQRNLITYSAESLKYDKILRSFLRGPQFVFQAGE